MRLEIGSLVSAMEFPFRGIGHSAFLFGKPAARLNCLTWVEKPRHALREVERALRLWGVCAPRLRNGKLASGKVAAQFAGKRPDFGDSKSRIAKPEIAGPNFLKARRFLDAKMEVQFAKRLPALMEVAGRSSRVRFGNFRARELAGPRPLCGRGGVPLWESRVFWL